MQGGFFNQLFQWYASLHLKNHFSEVKFSKLFLDLYLPHITKRKFELRELIGDTNIENNIKSLSKLVTSKYLGKIINNDLTSIQGDEKIAIGFFQQYKIVDENWTRSIDHLTKYDFLNKSIIEESRDYVAIHIRLKDYLFHEKTKKHHGLTSPKYYLDSIEYLYSIKGEKKVKIITDSFIDVRETTDLLHKNKIIFEVVSTDFKSDFLTLALGDSIIMSNSSFSWWAAYIAKKSRDSEVIAPFPWFSDEKKQPKDLIPKNWFQMKRDIF